MENLLCDFCGKMFEREKYKIDRAEKHFCSKDCRCKGQESTRRNSRIEFDIVYLDLPNGKTSEIDIIDKDLAELNWYSQNDYVIRKNKERKYVYMHKVILERKLKRSLIISEEVDHINGKRSDNRRINLRLASRIENCANIRKKQEMKIVIKYQITKE